MKSSNPPNELENIVLDNLATAVVVFDRDYRIRYMNQTAEMLLAVSARHVIGQLPESWFSCEEGSVVNLIEATSGGQPYTKRGLTLNTGSNAEVTVDCTLVPAEDAEGRPIIIAEFQQVDRHQRISREEQLIWQQTVSRDLVRGLAHEIKNPLGGIRGAAQLLEAELDDPDFSEYTEVIISEADRLQELVNRLLGPNNRPDYRELNIHHVLERVRKLILAESGEGVHIVRDYDPSIPDLTGDMDQLIQAVLNIVRNAMKAIGDAGTITLRTRIQRQYTIGTRRHRLVAQVDIVDNGPGIPQDIADTLFFPMVTHGTGGMGLGLPIAQSVINQHHGLVECTSRPGHTVFSILLPLDASTGTRRQESQ